MADEDDFTVTGFAGGNAYSKSVTVMHGQTSAQLKAYITRIEHVQEVIDAANADKAEVYAEAKACGFDVKTMKRLVERRRKEREAVVEQDSMLEVYEGIMEGNNSSPVARKKLRYGPDIEKM